MSVVSPTSPVDRRDIRSAAVPSKRDKQHGSKWAYGTRPSAGCRTDYSSPTEPAKVVGGSDAQRMKVRPVKPRSQEYVLPSIDHAIVNINSAYEPKTHGNRTPKLYANAYEVGHASGRVARKTDAHFEANDSPLSRSLLELLPQHSNNTDSPIQTALRSPDSEILYSFDNKGPSPSDAGIKVVLEGLVEKAEQKWVAEQTEKIIRGEYEVLDGRGETTSLRKGKRSPKQKAAKQTVVKDIEEDDGFELV